MPDLGPTARFDVEEAPDELALVQALLNTASVGRFPDLLGEVETAGEWLAAAGLTAAGSAGAGAAQSAGQSVGRSADAARPTETDLVQLRAFRDELRRLTRGSGGSTSWSGVAALDLGADGVVELKPGGGAGSASVISKVLSLVFVAQRGDTWRRLKTCRNERCQVAFYDRSRNNSGAWHDVKTCGNQANLRAHRERNR
ncbi:CGNR zinc finger domain-containing protein [Kribbella sp. NPDC006257]|uniref:CGNR zinc finger domain-containing protein n=1 Tax=Kribbella sp. NPDC006257 TaxID=3156738 RepID=UPI0033AAA6A0